MEHFLARPEMGGKSPRSPTPPVQILAYQAAVVKVADQQVE
jgi:hypothetical protein